CRRMQRLGQPLDHVAGFMNLAALDRRMGAEGATDGFAQRLGAVNDEQPADLGIKPALDQVVDERLHDGGVLGCSFDQGERMFVAFPSMPRAAISTRSLPMCNPSIWTTRRSSLDRSGGMGVCVVPTAGGLSLSMVRSLAVGVNVPELRLQCHIGDDAGCQTPGDPGRRCVPRWSLGVPLGANRPAHNENWSQGNPASSADGISGAIAARRLPLPCMI